MYVNKMIFMERNEINDTTYDMLQDNNIICDTDYGTTEIMADSIKNLIENNKDYTNFENYTKEQTIELLKLDLGNDVVNAMLNNELDFILIVY